jgi:hypothetical protein
MEYLHRNCGCHSNTSSKSARMRGRYNAKHEHESEYRTSTTRSDGIIDILRCVLFMHLAHARRTIHTLLQP